MRWRPRARRRHRHDERAGAGGVTCPAQPAGACAEAGATAPGLVHPWQRDRRRRHPRPRALRRLTRSGAPRSGHSSPSAPGTP